MTDRILDQRLHDQAGHQGIFHLRCDVSFDAQGGSKTNPLDCDVVVEKGHLFSQRDLLPVASLERKAEQVAQVFDHADAPAWGRALPGKRWC